MADWTKLPIDILGLIVQNFDLVEDYHKFRAVCKSWRSSIQEEGKPKFSRKFPILIVTEPDYEEKEGSLIFYSQLTSQLLEMKFPEAACKRRMGIYPGWILTVGRDFQIDVLNPFTRRQFNLPSMLRFKDQYEDVSPTYVVEIFVTKVIASTSPEQDDCVLLAIYGRFDILAFARIGDGVWTNISVSTRGFAVYYKGKFCAVDRRGVVFVCDLHHKDGPLATVASPTLLAPFSLEHYQKYLVESCGDLYLLFRERKGYSEEYNCLYGRFTSGFYVFRLVRDDGNHCKYPSYRLEEVYDLGDSAFFIGYNPSISTSSSDCVRANSIYFGDDKLMRYLFGGGGRDMGIFDMKTKKVEDHYHVSQFQFQFRSPINPPFWFFN